ncbi:MAG: hypothetical protein BWY06_03101 [Candidatus Latescibacteria bacterium ADurb.Bin168]|nr:MAG: hypothetical protein BWY06_03101 [Candidatus Latescibacteria bacterium ADurb.Bin168]
MRLEEDPRFRADGDFPLNRFVAIQGSPNYLLKLRVPHHFLDQSSIRSRQVCSQEPCRREVQVDHPLPRIYRNDAFNHAGKNGLLLIPLTNQRTYPLVELSRHCVERFGEVVNFRHT